MKDVDELKTRIEKAIKGGEKRIIHNNLRVTLITLKWVLAQIKDIEDG